MTDAATQSWLDAATEGPDFPGREAARGAFAKTGLPHRRMEDWKYTDLRTRLHEALPAAEGFASDGAHPFADLGGVTVKFGNGSFIGIDGALPQGVDVRPLGDAAALEWVKAHLGRGTAPVSHPMVALNEALAHDGVAIGLAKNAKSGTIILAHEGHSGRQTIRNLIKVEGGAQLMLVENHLGGDEAQQVQQVNEIFVAPGAKLTHVRLQTSGAKTVFLATDLVDVAEGADYRGFVLTSGGELARQESFIEFSGEGAEAHISGAYLLSGKQHSDFTTRVTHAVPNCVSREVFKGVIADEARGVFQGRIIVAEDAQKTDGHMLNKTLLLSDRAEIDAKPELEIYADDVKCSHGATAGQLDANQLFYLRARGIDEAMARGLLMQSFLSEALEEVADERIRAVLQAHVDSWLAAHGAAWRAAA